MEQTHKVLRLRPKELFDKLLREGIFQVANGAKPSVVGDELATQFLEQAASPGLAILNDPFTLAQDYCAILRTSLESISRMQLPKLKAGGTIKVGAHKWQMDAYRDEAGELHRWITVDRYDQEIDLYRELHSWYVFGDCAASGANMWLHFLEIGRTMHGHQVSSWCRIFKHPHVANVFRFRQQDGTPLQGGWTPFYYQDGNGHDPKTWVDLMEQDGLEMIYHRNVSGPRPEDRESFEVSLDRAAKNIAEIPKSWRDCERRRTSCDIPPCPWDAACYGNSSTIEGAGGFVKIQ